MSLRDKRQTNCRKSQRINTCLSVSQSLGLPSSQSLSFSLILTVCPCSTHASLLVCLSVGMSCWHWRWLLDWQKTQATVRVCKFIPDVNIPIGSHFTQVSCLFAQIAPTAADIAVHTLMYVRLAVPAQPVSLCGCVYECVCVCVAFAIFALYCCQKYQTTMATAGAVGQATSDFAARTTKYAKSLEQELLE